MRLPLHEPKAQLFRALGHPVRVRVLELLLAGPKPVRDLVAELSIGSAQLSQQLAVLRGAGVVISRRSGNGTEYSLSTPEVGALLSAARHVLACHAVDQGQLLAELRTERAS